ncbi:Aspartate aminotransferase, partial [Operophtera brumata]
AFGVQTLSGTGGLRVGAEFLNKHLNYNTFYYSSPTWENHHLVFVNSGFTHPRSYRYWNPKTCAIDFAGFVEDLSSAPKNSERKLFPFFDSAYQGFASGDLDRDAWAVRYFVKRGFELVCAQSYAKNFGLYRRVLYTSGDLDRDAWAVRYFVKRGFELVCAQSYAKNFGLYSEYTDLNRDAWAVRYFVKRGFELVCAQSYAKNFGLYNERVGNLVVVLNDAKLVAPIKSQLTWIVRGMYSNPPAHGARVVATVLGDTQLYDEWYVIIFKLGTPGNWDHIVKQIGLFSYTGLSQRQTEHMVESYHIYLLKSGRINICGLNPSNVAYVAKAMHDAITQFPVFPECKCD